VTISAGTLQSGDVMSFTSPAGSGITSSYSGGVLTLSGSATVAQYQAALQSITFSTTSTSTTARAISIVALDGALTSNAAPEQVNVVAPVTIIGAYVSGSTWNDTAGSEDFDGYWSTHGLGNTTNPSLGYALQTGSAQLTSLPWAYINTISVQFSGPVSNIGLGSLELLGGTGGGAVAAPAVTGFKSDGNNTYSWTLASSLGNNKYVLAIATTGSSFGTPGSTQVTGANGAGVSGTFTTSSSSFPSGNGLAGSTFDFFFDVLPGDGKQTGTVNSADAAVPKATLNDAETTSGYSPYFDYAGAGLINSGDAAIADVDFNKTQSGITGPTAPSASQRVATIEATGFIGLALSVQETGSSQPSGLPVSNVGNLSSASTILARTTLAAATAASPGSTSGRGSESTRLTPPERGQHGRHGRHFEATDEAPSDFDPTDRWVGSG
jgi:hypothetical protein